MIKIAPSTLPANESQLLNYALKLQESGADYLHVDVMDGVFVNNSALDYDTVFKISYGCLLPIDIHLMVANPISQIKQYLKVKPNYITIHYESFSSYYDIIEAIQLIKKNKVLVGLAINPSTNVEKISQYLQYVDLVLPMSVVPGKGGQAFIENTLSKYEYLHNYRKKHNLSFKIQADGGINETNISEVYKRGVDIAVVGSAIYNAINKKDYIDKIKSKFIKAD